MAGATFRPAIDKRSRKIAEEVFAGAPPGAGDFLVRSTRWAEAREEWRQRAEAARREASEAGITLAPAIDAHSRELARRLMARESMGSATASETSGLSVTDTEAGGSRLSNVEDFARYEDRLQARHTAARTRWEHRVDALLSEQEPFHPAITTRAAKLQREGQVGERLYEYAAHYSDKREELRQKAKYEEKARLAREATARAASCKAAAAAVAAAPTAGPCAVDGSDIVGRDCVSPVYTCAEVGACRGGGSANVAASPVGPSSCGMPTSDSVSFCVPSPGGTAAGASCASYDGTHRSVAPRINDRSWYGTLRLLPVEDEMLMRHQAAQRASAAAREALVAKECPFAPNIDPASVAIEAEARARDPDAAAARLYPGRHACWGTVAAAPGSVEAAPVLACSSARGAFRGIGSGVGTAPLPREAGPVDTLDPECTFAPAIDPRSSRMDDRRNAPHGTARLDRMYRRHALTEQRRQAMAAEASAERMRECTFAPRTRRRTGSAPRRADAGESETDGKAREQSRSGKHTIDVTTRCEIWRARRDARLAQGREAEEAARVAACTFRPNADIPASAREMRMEMALAEASRLAPLDELTGAAEFVARQRHARAVREEAARERPVVWTGKLTQPKEFNFSTSRAEREQVRSLSRPVEAGTPPLWAWEDGHQETRISDTGGGDGCHAAAEAHRQIGIHEGDGPLRETGESMGEIWESGELGAREDAEVQGNLLHGEGDASASLLGASCSGGGGKASLLKPEHVKDADMGCPTEESAGTGVRTISSNGCNGAISPSDLPQKSRCSANGDVAEIGAHAGQSGTPSPTALTPKGADNAHAETGAADAVVGTPKGSPAGCT